MTEKYKGSEIILKTLLHQNINTIFGYPGGAVLPIYDAIFSNKDINHILVRHEQAAVHAAEGYARSSNKIGVILVTSGPGATNTITGLTDAYMDSIPILCISGQVPSHLIGSDAFQEADVTGITRCCTKYNYLISHVDEIEDVINESIHIATTGRPGPVLIDIPKDTCIATTQFKGDKKSYRASYTPHIPQIDKSQIAKAVDMIEQAKKPIFYTGGGLINSGEKACDELIDFVRKTQYPITSTLMGLGAYPSDDKQFLGMLGMHGTYEANMAMYHSDLIICLGARFDDRVTGDIKKFSPNSKKIHLDIDASSINKIISVDVKLTGNALDALTLMNQYWHEQNYQAKPEKIKDWWQEINQWKEKKSLEYQQKSDEITKPQFVLDTLNRLIQNTDTIVSTDVGQHQMWTAQFIKFNKPHRWLTSGGLGTMGYGVPAIVGAQIKHPDKLCICVTGEASIMMNIQELSTIKQYNLPVKILLLNNEYMGMVRQWQELFFDNRESSSYVAGLPDFKKLAESFGIKGLICTEPNKVEQTLNEAIEHQGPVLINCLIAKSENVYPMIPAGAGHQEIKLAPENKS